MEPKSWQVSALKQSQEDLDEKLRIDKIESAIKDKIDKQVEKAKVIAEDLAHYTGAHLYLGRDAVTRDYYSDWATLSPVEGEEDMHFQVRLTREYDILRDNQIETGVRFLGVGVDVKLYDPIRDLYSPTEIGLYRFDNHGVTKKEGMNES